MKSPVGMTMQGKVKSWVGMTNLKGTFWRKANGERRKANSEQRLRRRLMAERLNDACASFRVLLLVERRDVGGIGRRELWMVGNPDAQE